MFGALDKPAICRTPHMPPCHVQHVEKRRRVLQEGRGAVFAIPYESLICPKP